jgi:hypothetical protein
MNQTLLKMKKIITLHLFKLKYNHSGYVFKKLYPICLTFLLVSGISNCQTNSGITEDNYNGIHGVLINPANVTDSRISSEFNLFSLNLLLGNDYTPLNLSNITELIDGGNYTAFPNDDNNGLLNLDILGPSFMFNLNSKSSLAVTTRVRALVDLNNINGLLAESIADGFMEEDFNFNIANMDVTAHAWGEIGLAYGRTLYSKEDHFVKGGITLKYLLGGGVAQVNSNSISGIYQNSQQQDLLTLNGDLSYGSYESSEKLSPGFGADIGFVYEFRPKSNYSSSEDATNKAINKYKLKLGIALLDIGSITYKNLEQTTYNIDGALNGSAMEDDLEQALEDNFNGITTNSDTKVLLPTSLQINADYKIAKRFYASLNYNQALHGKDEPYSNNGLNLITLAPRFETRYFSLHMPFGYSKLGETSFGLGLRMGPLTLGSGTILSNLLSDKSNLANAYVGLKVPIYQKDKVKAMARENKREKAKEERKAEKVKRGKKEKIKKGNDRVKNA